MIDIKEFIKRQSKKFNISCLTVAPFRKFTETEQALKERALYPFECGSMLEKTDPFLMFENGKSILVCLFPYYNTQTVNLQFSSYSVLKDYHIVLKNILFEFCESIKNRYDEFEYKILVDSHPLPERYLAMLSGAGVIGKNNMLINEKTGTYAFIGIVLTNLELEPDTKINLTCIGCNKCIEMCPTGALSKEGYNPEKCLSAITQLKTLTDEQEMLLTKSNCVFGCDICQRVCPHNKGIEETEIADFKDFIVPTFDELKEMSNKEFKNKYSDCSFAWRGKNILLRNFEIINKK